MGLDGGGGREGQPNRLGGVSYSHEGGDVCLLQARALLQFREGDLFG